MSEPLHQALLETTDTKNPALAGFFHAAQVQDILARCSAS